LLAPKLAYEKELILASACCLMQRVKQQLLTRISSQGSKIFFIVFFHAI